MKILKALQERKTKAIGAMKALLDSVGENALSEEQQKEYDAHKVEVDRLKAQISERESLLALESENAQARPAVAQASDIGRFAPEAKREFESFGEFVHAVRFQPNDQRLAAVDQRMDEGSQGGFAVPKQFRDQLLAVTPSQAIVRPRATVIPAGSPPDAEISMPALNQGTSKGMYAGVTVTWIGEGGTKPQTDMAIREITLKPKEVAAHIVATDKLLRNWGAASSLIEQQLRAAIASAEDAAFLSGNGAARPLGLINSAGAISVNRTTASRVVTADIFAMFAKMHFDGGSPEWLASQSIIPYLLTLKDANDNYIYVKSLGEGAPATLMGYPIRFNSRQPVLGSKGDLIFGDLKSYLIKDGSGPFVEASPHVYFTTNKTVIKAFWNVDGQMWLDGPLLLEDGSTQASPVVILDVPAA